MYALLLWHGHRARLQVGVTKSDDGTFMAHAWVEDGNGEVLAENLEDLESYKRLAAFEKDNMASDVKE